MLDQAIAALEAFLVRHGRSAQLVEYIPYALPILLLLLWYGRNLVWDALRELRYLARKHSLRLIRGDRIFQSPSCLRYLLGELGPCPREEPGRKREEARTAGLREPAKQPPLVVVR